MHVKDKKLTVTQCTEKDWPNANEVVARVLASLWVDGHDKDIIKGIKKDKGCAALCRKWGIAAE